MSLFLLLFFLLFSSPILSRNTTKSRNFKSFDSTFPSSLVSNFTSCASIPNPGTRGVCQILSAISSQLHSLPSPSSSSSSSASSCQFHLQNGQSLHRYATDPSPELQSLLSSYSQMHRSCLQSDRRNLPRFLSSNPNATSDSSLRCRYVFWSCTFGLGNKLMSLVSTFLYALISQRVLLLDDSSMDSLFCQPFPGSSWTLPDGLSLKDDPIPSPDFKSFLRRCDRKPRGCDSPRILSAVFSADSTPDDHRLLVCPSVQSAVRDVPILHFRNSNQYFATGFFLNPALRPVLDVLFPDRRVFHSLSRFLLAPSDSVWESITSLASRSFSGSTRTVGVQLRESKGEYREFYDTSVPRCIRQKSGLCPIEVDEFQERKREGGGPVSELLSSDKYSVYVSSLVGKHSERLKESLGELEGETGQRFEVTGQDADGEQMDDVDHQRKALVDMWMLSMADVLMTSHMSTFGYTAQGLAGLTPYLLKPWDKDPCWEGVSSDPCFHFGPSRRVTCKQDGFDMRRGVEVERLLKACPDLPDTGLQLVELY